MSLETSVELPTPAEPDYSPLLMGRSVQLWPWVRGMWPRETPFRLWQFLEAERAGPRIFWGAPGLEPTVVADLIEFVRFLEPERGRREVLMAQALDASPEQAFAGLVWFDDLVPGWRALAGIWYRRRYWGPVAAEASRLARDYMFARYGLRSLWAFTPWRAGRRHAERAGFELVSTIPAFVQIDGVVRDIAVLRLDRPSEVGGNNGRNG